MITLNSPGPQSSEMTIEGVLKESFTSIDSFERKFTASYTCRMLLLFLNKSDLLIRCMPPTLAHAVAAHQKVIGTITRGRHTATDRGHGPPHHLCVMTDSLYIVKGH